MNFCQVLDNGGEKWVDSLRKETYLSACEKLVKLPGVGNKVGVGGQINIVKVFDTFLFQVADCVCLMALDKPEAVPVDTHIRQIAARKYGHHILSKSLTPSGYKQLGFS